MLGFFKAISVNGEATIAAIVIAILLAAGCSKEPSGGEHPLPEGRFPIAAMPSVNGSNYGWPSKAPVTSSTDLQNHPMHLFGTATRNGENHLVFADETLEYSNGSWDYSPTKYWIPGASYTFGAFWRSIENNGTINFSAQTPNILRIEGCSARNDDLLYASYVRDNTVNQDYSTVQFNLLHAFACIELNIRNTTNTNITKISDITLSGLTTVCTLQINFNYESINFTDTSEDSYSNDGERTGENSGPFLPEGMASNEFKPIFNEQNLTVVPQALFNREIYLSFNVYFESNNSEPIPYKVNLGTIEALKSWESGKKYKYNFTISSQDIIFQVSEVPWIEHKVEL